MPPISVNVFSINNLKERGPSYYCFGWLEEAIILGVSEALQAAYKCPTLDGPYLKVIMLWSKSH